MNRQEQIKQAAKEYADDGPDKVQNIIAQVGFEMGAEWADEHPHWISVDDELPPIRQGVIAYNGVTNRIAWVLEDGSWIADTHKEWERNCFKQYPVTHWMPLPAPPKKGGES